jgi:hypothetical protein
VIVPGFDDADVSLFEARLTLREIIDANNHLFYPQTWMNGEAFMDRIAEPLPLPTFSQWSFYYLFPKQESQRASAASLALCYVNNPDADIWSKYLWCDDQDSLGQRVYIGGKSNTGKLEIHRHLSITSRWGLPSWP